MTKENNFGFDNKKSNLTVTKIANGKIHASFDAIAEDGTVESREFVWKIEGNKILVKTADGKLKVTSKDDVLNQASKALEAMGPTGRELSLTKHQLEAERSLAEGGSEGKGYSKLSKIRQSLRDATENDKLKGLAAVLGAALIGGATLGGIVINNKNTAITDLKDDLKDKDTTLKAQKSTIHGLDAKLAKEQAGWSGANDTISNQKSTISDLTDRVNDLLNNGTAYQLGLDAGIEASEAATVMYINSHFDADKISTVTDSDLNTLNLTALLDVANELSLDAGEEQGYAHSVDALGTMLAAEGVNESAYQDLGLMGRVVLYGQTLVNQNGTFDAGYDVALQEAVGVADDILGAAKAGQYDKVEALVKAYGEALAAHTLELTDYTQTKVTNWLNGENVTMGLTALERIANNPGLGKITLAPNQPQVYQAVVANMTDEQMSEANTLALGAGYTSFSDMYNQDVGFVAYDTYGEGAVALTLSADGNDEKVVKMSQGLYDNIKRSLKGE